MTAGPTFSTDTLHTVSKKPVIKFSPQVPQNQARMGESRQQTQEPMTAIQVTPMERYCVVSSMGKISSSTALMLRNTVTDRVRNRVMARMKYLLLGSAAYFSLRERHQTTAQETAERAKQSQIRALSTSKTPTSLSNPARRSVSGTSSRAWAA